MSADAIQLTKRDVQTTRSRSTETGERVRTFHQRRDGHQSVLLHSTGARRTLKHPQQRRHHHVGDLQGVLVLHFAEDILENRKQSDHCQEAVRLLMIDSSGVSHLQRCTQQRLQVIELDPVRSALDVRLKKQEMTTLYRK